MIQSIDHTPQSTSEVKSIFINLKAIDEPHLKSLLTKAIYDYRLYTDKQLEALFDKAKQQNEFQVEHICDTVKRELDFWLYN